MSRMQSRSQPQYQRFSSFWGVKAKGRLKRAGRDRTKQNQQKGAAQVKES